MRKQLKRNLEQQTTSNNSAVSPATSAIPATTAIQETPAPPEVPKEKQLPMWVRIVESLANSLNTASKGIFILVKCAVIIALVGISVVLTVQWVRGNISTDLFMSIVTWILEQALKMKMA
ncbi:hypothetical protein DRW41_22050 [Neobacillus piezotolerans]|uniref:Uncharacterized protein n=1 Tax=Neobacillus piezotolerans TaxID=2259171 RepID=A0A3D8GJS9_9BACI|nr:hypothetical protein [Neobacillus piezotolerans]RDU34710.1 hypothetical protein DRW41_22050 [Neobacillus piezotolerans]